MRRPEILSCAADCDAGGDACSCVCTCLQESNKSLFVSVCAKDSLLFRIIFMSLQENRLYKHLEIDIMKSFW